MIDVMICILLVILHLPGFVAQFIFIAMISIDYVLLFGKLSKTSEGRASLTLLLLKPSLWPYFPLGRK